MTTRFCPGCRAEVEDTGGFCLLGHRLSLDAPVASLKDLRAEVDDSFRSSDLTDLEFVDDADEAWDRLVEPALAGAVAVPAAPVRPARSAPVRRVPPPPPPPPPPAPRTTPTTVTERIYPSTVQAPVTAPARRVPPPPPATDPKLAPPPVGPARTPSNPDQITPAERKQMLAPPPPAVLPPHPAAPVMGEDMLSSDPITSFAPPPRMDWGPEKGRLKLRGRRSRRSEETA